MTFKMAQANKSKLSFTFLFYININYINLKCFHLIRVVIDVDKIWFVIIKEILYLVIQI